MEDDILYIIFCSRIGIFPKLIALFTGASATKVDHAALMWKDKHLGWLILGANFNGVTIDCLSNFLKEGITIESIWCPLPPNPSLWIGLEALKSKINVMYNYTGILGMSLVEIQRIFGKNPKHNFLSNKKTEFCSQLVDEVSHSSGYDLLPQDNPNVVDPMLLRHTIIRDKRFQQFTDIPSN